MRDTTGRRRFLQLAGTGTAISVAGCNAFQSDGPSGDGGDGGDGADGGDDGDEATVAVAVQPDQEALQERHAEIQSAVQSGNMSQEEAQQAAQQAQIELTAAAVESFEGRVADESELAIEDSIPEIGAFLATGTPAALIGTLPAEEVSALLPESVFEEARSQASGGSGGSPAGTGDQPTGS